MKRDSIFKISPHTVSSVKGERDELGFKAFALAHMARLGLPVPPAFVLGTHHCRLWRQDPEHYRK